MYIYIYVGPLEYSPSTAVPLQYPCSTIVPSSDSTVLASTRTEAEVVDHEDRFEVRERLEPAQSLSVGVCVRRCVGARVCRWV